MHLPDSDQLLAHIDGDSNAAISTHLATCDECHRTVLEYGLVQRQLRAALYRFDCPSPHLLGEYALDLLIDPERRQMAEHALGCSECADELHIARAFFARDVPVAAPGGWRRAIASLFRPSGHIPAVAVRGDARETSSEYHAGRVHVVLGTLPARERDSVDLDGLVMHESAAPEAVAGCYVALVVDNRAVYATRTDELGNFAFENVATGTYQLEIHIDHEVVVIEDLALARPRPK